MSLLVVPFLWRWMVALSDLRWIHDPVVVVAIFTRPTLAIIFHPPDPPIALQSITRDAPFSQAAMAQRTVRRSISMVLPSSLVVLQEGGGRVLRFAMELGPYLGGRRGDRETQCSKVRSDNISDGSSLRSEAGIRPCSLVIA